MPVAKHVPRGVNDNRVTRWQCCRIATAVHAGGSVALGSAIKNWEFFFNNKLLITVKFTKMMLNFLTAMEVLLTLCNRDV